MAAQKKPNLANPLELAREIASQEAKGFADSFTEAVGLNTRKTDQSQPWGGEMAVSQQVQTLEKQAQQAEQKVENLQAQLFKSVQRETKEVYNIKKERETQRIRELVANLAKEVSSLKFQTGALTGEVKNITVETVTDGAQTYHLNFFEWILTMLQDIKKDIIKSRTWLSAFKSKKAKKGYWAMFKKHGTSFAMSDERSLAQSG